MSVGRSGSKVKTFEGYALRRKLGEGAMGSVYLVADDDGTEFALKILKREAAKRGGYAARFKREMRIALKLNHENIVETHHVGEAADGTLYMICEFCPGGCLDVQMTRHGTVGVDQAIRWMLHLASALDYAHREHALIHRDIKPANLLLDAKGRLKVGDFGLARGTTVDATRLTAEGMVIGSAYYMSPEQALAEDDLDVRADLYSAGCTFYRLLAGVQPFRGKNAAETMKMQVEAKPKRLSQHRPDLPIPLVMMIHNLLQKERDKRPETPAVWLKQVGDLVRQLKINLRETPDSAALVDHSQDAPAGEKISSVAPTVDTGEKPQIPAEPDEEAPEIERPPSAPETARPAAEAGSIWPDTCAWLRITESESSSRWDVVIFVDFPVRFGRAIDGKVEIPLRIYPVDDNLDDCMRISSLHGQFEANGDGWMIRDFGSRNGIAVDYQDLAPNDPFELPGQAVVDVSSAIKLECFSLRRTGKDQIQIASRAQPVAKQPALVITRAENRRELLSVLLRDRLPIGGKDPSTGLALPNHTGQSQGILWWLNERFWWQPHKTTVIRNQACEPSQLMPLRVDDQWNTGTLHFSLRRYSLGLFA